jgi:pimeloyl-ACP methyl ester carboxylesterase
MALACRHPARVARLVVVDIAPKEYPGFAQRSEIAAMQELRLGELRSRAEAELRLEARVEDPAMRRFLATNLERGEDGQWRWIVNLPVLARTLPDLVKSPLAPDDRFAGPAHFILGGKSRFVAPEDHALIRRHFPAARITVMAESGHNPHIEAREALVRLVAEEV